MPGLAKALKRRRRKARPTKLDAIFDWHTRFAVAPVTTEDGDPGLVVAVYCTDEQFARYTREARGASSARIRAAENDTFALDLFGANGPVGRLLTTGGDRDALPVLLAMLHSGEADTLEIHLVHATNALDAEVLRVPVAVDRVTDEEFHGEPVVVGNGEYCAMTVSAHDGTIFVHRFTSKEDAQAQLDRNVEANAPFVDAKLD